MTQNNIAEAEKIAQTYFRLLIERHKQLGYKADVIPDPNNKSDTNPVYFLRFTNDENESKLYKIIPFS